MNERDVKVLAEGARERDHRGWWAQAWETIGYARWRDLVWVDKETAVADANDACAAVAASHRRACDWERRAVEAEERARKLEQRLAEIQAVALRDL